MKKKKQNRKHNKQWLVTNMLIHAMNVTLNRQVEGLYAYMMGGGGQEKTSEYTTCALLSQLA